MDSLLLECQGIMMDFSQSHKKLTKVDFKGDSESFADVYGETREKWNRLRALLAKYPSKELQDLIETLERELIWSWFRTAVFDCSAEALEYLFVKGEKLNLDVSETGVPLLHLAVEVKDLRKVELLLKNGADVDVELHNPVELPGLTFDKPIPFKKGTTALHRAIVSEQEEIINLLLDHGADIFKADVDKDTVMHQAARMGDLKTVQLLYAQGASIDGTDKYSRLPLNYAILEGHTEVAQFLLNRLTHNRDSIIDEALCSSARAGIDIVTLLLDAGANVNATDSEHETCLHHAASEGCLEVAKLLLDRGAEIDFLNNIDKTPLHLSITSDNIPMIKLLLQNGADVNARTLFDRTCLHYATCMGDLEIVKLLLDNQADIFAKDDEGETVLLSALDGGCAEDSEMIDTCNYLVRWMIWEQLDLARCAVELNNIKSNPVYKDIKKHLVECEEEMLSIKTEEIQTTSVRYYDVIDKLSLAQLVKLSRNETIAQAFEFNSLSAKFPIFAPKLHKPYQRAVEKRDLLEKARRVFCSLYDGDGRKHPILPYFFTEDVFKYLSDEDLINFALKF